MKKFVSLLAVSALLATGSLASTVVLAQDDPNVPGHPRVNEVDQRLENQQDRTNAGVNNGQINAKQEERDTNRDNRVQSEMSKDEAAHNGHLTKAEQHHMNKQLNHNSKDIHRQRNGKNFHERKVHPTPTPSSTSPTTH